MRVFVWICICFGLAVHFWRKEEQQFHFEYVWKDVYLFLGVDFFVGIFLLLLLLLNVDCEYA